MKPKNWQKIEALFHQALELPLVERDAFLEDQCGDDHYLLNAVSSLLKHANKESVIEAAVQQAPGHIND